MARAPGQLCLCEKVPVQTPAFQTQASLADVMNHYQATMELLPAQ